MIDFHAHILPGVDHGSDSLETSVRQMELASEAGIDTLVATPHFYPQYDEPQEYLERRGQAFALLQAHKPDNLQVLLGAEVNLCSGLEHLGCLEQLRICGTKTILLELPMPDWPPQLMDTLQNLLDSPWYTPVLAHVDRYREREIETLLSMGFLGQVNADAICRLGNKKRLYRWIENGSIVALGSDIHGTQIGYTQYDKARKLLCEHTQIIMERTQALLHE